MGVSCGCSCGEKLSETLRALARLEARVAQLEDREKSRDSNPATDPVTRLPRREVSGCCSPDGGSSATGHSRTDPPVPINPSRPQVIPQVPRSTELPMTATRVVMQQLCRPLDADKLGVCFGGTVLSWVDLCAGLASKMAARGPCVTASVDAVHFVRPLRVNTIVLVEAMVNCTFSSSMEVGVRVYEEEPSSGERSQCCHAFLTFVSLQSLKRPGNPEPRPLPRMVPGSKDEEMAKDMAAIRRQQRLSKREAQKQKKHLPQTFHREIAVPDTSSARRSASLAEDIHITPDATLSHMTQMVMPQHANTLGITFGGQVLSWLEQAAYLSAVRLNLSGHMLTAAMDAVTFKESTKVGDLLYFTSCVTAVFKTSVEVMVSVFGDKPHDPNSEPFFVLDAFVTLVSVGVRGEPQTLKLRLDATSEAELLRMEEAQQRRLERLEMRQAFVQQALRTVRLMSLKPEPNTLEAPSSHEPSAYSGTLKSKSMSAVDF